jgi:serine/threonine protein kinase/Flp pilus assembly protein TadD
VADYSGKLIGKYEVRERLGRGGMAEVYKAFHPNLNRSVALKILHPHLADAPDFIGRFRREAQSVAQLHHPHIVQIFDFDAQADLTYMVMEYIAGPSLKARLDDLYRRGERLPLAEVLAIFRALLDAVGYAHQQGIVHRDLKPANVMLEAKKKESANAATSLSSPLSFRPVLTDFGIAKIMGGDAQRFTATQATIGTPAYMSPEQGQGHGGDERSDLYALGIMLYECLTGQVPYEGDTSVSVLLKHVTSPIPALRALRPDLPEALERIIWTALAKDPGERFQTAGDFWQALAAIKSQGEQTTEATPQPVARPRSRHTTVPHATPPDHPTRPQLPLSRSIALSAGLVGLMALGIFALIWLRPNANSPDLTEGYGYLAEGRYQLAADSFGAALTQAPDQAQALLGHAQAMEELGLVDEALDDIERLIATAPAAAAGYRERARLMLQYFAFEPTAVLADLDRALALAGGNPSEAAQVHFRRGWAIFNFPLMEETPNPGAALDDLRQAVALEANNAEMQFTLAQALLATGQAAEAITPANRALELGPEVALYFKLRSHIYFSLRDFNTALDDLAAAIERESDDSTLAILHSERAYLLAQLGDPAEAQTAVQTALTHDPTLTLAQIVAHQLDATQPLPAATEIQRAQALVPDDPIWQAILASA